MVLVIHNFKEEGIFIIGVFGLEERILRSIERLLEHLIANLELRDYLFGIVSRSLPNQRIEIMNHQYS